MKFSGYNFPVAENIQRIINEKGLKRVYVAEKAGYTAQMLSDMLSGRKIIKACLPLFCAASWNQISICL